MKNKPPLTKKKLRLTAQRKKVVNKMMNDNCKVFVSFEAGVNHYSFTDGSSNLKDGIAERMIKAKLLVPSDDGLIPGITQTYRLADHVIEQQKETA